MALRRRQGARAPVRGAGAGECGLSGVPSDHLESIMRRIIESTLVSIDGVIGDPHLWATDYFGDEARADALKQLLASDAMLMGRRTYEIFAKHWPAQNGAYADRINRMRK